MDKLPKISKQALQEVYKTMKLPKKPISASDRAMFVAKIHNYIKYEQPVFYGYLLDVIETLEDTTNGLMHVQSLPTYLYVFLKSIEIQKDIKKVNDMFKVKDSLDIRDAAGYGGEDMPQEDFLNKLKDILDSENS